MATITLKNSPIHTIGHLPPVGRIAPPFRLTTADLSDVGLESFKGKKKIINIVPSLDTGVCATSARRFNEKVAKLNNIAVLIVSADLPFAQKRFCEIESLNNIVALSTMRSLSFGKDYGVQIIDGPLSGLMSRAVLVLDTDNKIIYTEQVPEITQEPNYDAALAAIRK